ncbi:MAG: hypothetical protein GWN00_01515 [Aliifodinibius sp.]|nr:hypothetical protein [Phycisphaerae bacterium]NIR62356.1 hypothetical protein [candidate division Zixibacteria bacterium]NIT54956.1 hypothetical protein [Fodinibius sp.]NIW43367.1 hypothetical protein [Gammaproteobacteria bacterium]NIU12589.1 hypothetical protein [candidate division Zixibacteria bacterium]
MTTQEIDQIRQDLENQIRKQEELKAAQKTAAADWPEINRKYTYKKNGQL